MNRRTTLLLALCLPALLASCVSTPGPGSGEMAAVAPMLSVERFLQATNSQDFDTMARLFGTRSGTMVDQQGNTLSCAFRKIGSWFRLNRACVQRTDVELRMNAIAMILQHDDYEIRTENRVPGRSHPTVRIGVDLLRGSNRFADVPFVVVQTSEGRWLVEEIGLESVTGSR